MTYKKPMNATIHPTIAIFAGETSGDQLGGWLMAALARKRPDIRFIGVGGANMQGQGLASLFPMQELSVIGFAEVLPHAMRLKRRIRETADYIMRERPQIVVSIDSLGFNFRVNELLRARGMQPLPTFVHYVAPTVWAYKAHRAKKVAQIMDCQLTLLPFEPPYFTKEGIRAECVGHEIAWWWREKGDGAAFRARHGLSAEAPVLAVFPGSRVSELKRLLPIFSEAVTRLRHTTPTLQVVMQIPPALTPLAQALLEGMTPAPLLVSDPTEKKDLFAASDVALAKSGTIGLECALAGLPSVTAYKANALTAAFVRRLLKTPFVNLANVLLGRMAIPELLQEHCTAEEISVQLSTLLNDAQARDAQRAAIATIGPMLGTDDAQSPSDKAAAIILEYL